MSTAITQAALEQLSQITPEAMERVKLLVEELGIYDKKIVDVQVRMQDWYRDNIDPDLPKDCIPCQTNKVLRDIQALLNMKQ